MMKNFGNMGNMMKQAQAMQENMQKAQQDLQNLEVTGAAGAGLVSVVMTGKHDIKKVNIDDSLMQDDKEMLEDLLAAAVNNANQLVEKASEEKMSYITGGFPLPPGMKLPF